LVILLSALLLRLRLLRPLSLFLSLRLLGALRLPLLLRLLGALRRLLLLRLLGALRLLLLPLLLLRLLLGLLGALRLLLPLLLWLLLLLGLLGALGALLLLRLFRLLSALRLAFFLLPRISRLIALVVLSVHRSHRAEEQEDSGRTRRSYELHANSSHISILVPFQVLLDDPASLNQLDGQHDQCDHQQYVNHSAHRIGSNQAQCPKHQQNYKNSPEHVCVFLFSKSAIPILSMGNWGSKPLVAAATGVFDGFSANY